jgi:hypothetical protein
MDQVLDLIDAQLQERGQASQRPGPGPDGPALFEVLQGSEADPGPLSEFPLR